VKLHQSLMMALVTLALGGPGCQTGDERPAGLDLAQYRVLDLTHTFDGETIYWPTDQPFTHEQKAWGVTPGGYWYSSFTLAGSEHGGTHLDAPIHFGEGKRAADQIPVEQLIGEAAVIDIGDRCAQNPDYTLSAADIEAHESAHGVIPAEAIVLVRTGWGARWPEKKAYLGTDAPGDVENLHFPGVSPEAAELLVARGVAVVGIDTASIDPGVSRDFQSHQILSAAQLPVLENVASLDALPSRGALVFALPMKIGGGSGAPCRVVALVPPHIGS
jgi:kynurenine formamidase